MQKLFMLFALALLALPVFAAEAQSVADPNNCVTFPKGQKLCMSQTGTELVPPGGITLEKEGRYYGQNGMSVSAGECGGCGIFLGNPWGNSGIAIGQGKGVYVRGLYTRLPDKGFTLSHPLMTVDGTTFHADTTVRTTGDQGTTRVELPRAFRSISNLDRAAKGGYQVLVLFLDGSGVGLVREEDMFPDHFVVRSASPKQFISLIFAIGQGFEEQLKLTPQPDASVSTDETLDQLLNRDKQ